LAPRNECISATIASAQSAMGALVHSLASVQRDPSLTGFVKGNAQLVDVVQFMGLNADENCAFPGHWICVVRPLHVEAGCSFTASKARCVVSRFAHSASKCTLESATV